MRPPSTQSTWPVTYDALCSAGRPPRRARRAVRGAEGLARRAARRGKAARLAGAGSGPGGAGMRRRRRSPPAPPAARAASNGTSAPVRPPVRAHLQRPCHPVTLGLGLGKPHLVHHSRIFGNRRREEWCLGHPRSDAIHPDACFTGKITTSPTILRRSPRANSLTVAAARRRFGGQRAEGNHPWPTRMQASWRAAQLLPCSSHRSLRIRSIPPRPQTLHSQCLVSAPARITPSTAATHADV